MTTLLYIMFIKSLNDFLLIFSTNVVLTEVYEYCIVILLKWNFFYTLLFIKSVNYFPINVFINVNIVLTEVYEQINIALYNIAIMTILLYIMLIKLLKAISYINVFIKCGISWSVLTSFDLIGEWRYREVKYRVIKKKIDSKWNKLYKYFRQKC